MQEILVNIEKHSPFPHKVQLIAVTKKHDFRAIQSAINNNILNIGESRIQETEKKIIEKKICPDVKLHLIGHLQTNKAARANKLFDVIQSVDTVKLLKKLDTISQKNNNNQEVFLQVNVAENKKQTGFFEKDVFSAARYATKLKNLKLSGIMAIGTNTKNDKEIKKNFQKAKEIQQKIEKTINPQCVNLSIGMSGDYILALQEGATHIRIGSKLFEKND